MATQTAEGFGQSVLELRRNLALIYPEQARPIGAAAVCLSQETCKKRIYTPRTEHRQRGETYISGGDAYHVNVSHRSIHVVDENGESIHTAGYTMDAPKHVKIEHNTHDRLGSVEELVLERIMNSFALLADYAQAAGVPFEAETTFDLDKAPVTRRTWMLPACWPVKDGRPQGLEGFTLPAL